MYWLTIHCKSIDESCDGASVPACCHATLDTTEKYAFEVGVSSSRADFKSLNGAASAATGSKDWSGLVYLRDIIQS